MELQIKLDELEIIFNEDIFELSDIFKISLQNINTSNTDRATFDFTDDETCEYEKYTYSIFNVNWYNPGLMFSYTYQDEVINAFSILFSWKQWAVTTENKITIYGSFLQEKWRDYIYNLLENIFKTKEFIWLRRFDVACDIPIRKKELIDSFITTPKSTLNFNKKKQEHETIYFWQRSNRTRLIRIYDKILDTFKKEKNSIYDFTETDDLTRIEVEFWKTAIDAMNDRELYVDYKKLLKEDLLLKNLFIQSVYNHIWYFQDIDYTKHHFFYPRRHVQNLKEYYIKFNQLPDWYQTNWFWIFKKIKEAIWFEGFFDYLYWATELKNWLDKFLEFYYKKKWWEKKVLAKWFSKKTFIKWYYDMDQLSEDLFEVLYKNNKLDKEYVYNELNKTINKINQSL